MGPPAVQRKTMEKIIKKQQLLKQSARGGGGGGGGAGASASAKEAPRMPRQRYRQRLCFVAAVAAATIVFVFASADADAVLLLLLLLLLAFWLCIAALASARCATCNVQHLQTTWRAFYYSLHFPFSPSFFQLYSEMGCYEICV